MLMQNESVRSTGTVTVEQGWKKPMVF